MTHVIGVDGRRASETDGLGETRTILEPPRVDEVMSASVDG